MTLDQAAYNVLNVLSGGRGTNNEYISLRQIKFTINYHRSLLIRRDVERSRRIAELEQEFTADFSVIPAGEQGNLSLPYQIVKTDRDIPIPVRLKLREGLTFVGKQDQSKSYPVVNRNEIRWNQHNTYTFGTPKSYLIGRRLHIVGFEGLDSEQTYTYLIRGIFEDPEEVERFKDPYYEGDSEYPLPADMLQQITQSLINGEISVMRQTPNDTEQDTLPDHQVQ